MGVLQAQTCEVKEGVDTFRQGIQFNPKSSAGRYNFGKALSQQKHYEEALETYRRALSSKTASKKKSGGIKANGFYETTTF